MLQRVVSMPNVTKGTTGNGCWVPSHYAWVTPIFLELAPLLVLTVEGVMTFKMSSSILITDGGTYTLSTVVSIMSILVMCITVPVGSKYQLLNGLGTKVPLSENCT